MKLSTPLMTLLILVKLLNAQSFSLRPSNGANFEIDLDSLESIVFHDNEVDIKAVEGETTRYSIFVSEQISFPGVLGVAEYSSNARARHLMFAYPNPASGVLNIELSPDALGKITLYDIRGRSVHSIEKGQDYNKMDLAGLRPGVYFLKGSAQVMKVVKL